MRLPVNGQIAYIGTGSMPLAQPLDDTRRVIVCLHGAGMDHTIWTMVVRCFARHGIAALAPDLPGHGRSGGAPLATIEELAGWVEALLEGLGVEGVSLVGHSMGSLIATAFAARNPLRCEQLVLLGTAMPMPVTERLLDAAADNHHAAIDMANRWSHSNRAAMGGNRLSGIWMIGAGERLLERARPGVLHADLAACNAFSVPALESLKMPVSIIAGSADQMTPVAAGKWVAENLVGPARFCVLPGSGHSMLSEYPNEVLDLLIELLGIDTQPH